MKRFLIAIVAIAAIFNFSTSFAKPPTSAEQLRSEFEAALKAKDTNAVLALVNWKGVSDKMKPDIIDQMTGMVMPKTVSVNLLPLSADYQPTNEMNGIRYFPNVHVLGQINVETTEKGNTSQIPYGESNGGFYIAGVAQETFDAHAKKTICLGISVMGLFPKETPGILTCSYAYVTGGKEKNAGFQCTNNWSICFWGDTIKSCTVKKISGAGTFQLLINENGRKVFDSDMVETNDSISYEKKN